MLAIPPRRYFRTNVQIACILPQNTIHVNIIGFFVKKLAYLIFLLYLCSRFLNGGLRTPNLERFLQLDYSDVGWRIHSAPIEHPFSIHWEKVESTWKGGRNKVSKDYKDGKVFKGSKDGKVCKVFKGNKVLRDYFYSVSASDTCVRRSHPLS